MFVGTVIFSTKLGPSRETTVSANDLQELHVKIERIKRILVQNKLLFIGSIVEEIHGVTSEAGSVLDFMSQSGKMFH